VGSGPRRTVAGKVRGKIKGKPQVEPPTPSRTPEKSGVCISCDYVTEHGFKRPAVRGFPRKKPTEPPPRPIDNTRSLYSKRSQIIGRVGARNGGGTYSGRINLEQGGAGLFHQKGRDNSTATRPSTLPTKNRGYWNTIPSNRLR